MLSALKTHLVQIPVLYSAYIQLRVMYSFGFQPNGGKWGANEVYPPLVVCAMGMSPGTSLRDAQMHNAPFQGPRAPHHPV